MVEHSNKYIHILLVVFTLPVSILCFGFAREFVFFVYITINNGIYPPFMPAIIEVTRNCVGGFAVGLISMIMLRRIKYKIQFSSLNLLLVFLVLFKIIYNQAPVISFYTLRYEVILSGALAIILQFLVTKYMVSNKSFSRTR